MSKTRTSCYGLWLFATLFLVFNGQYAVASLFRNPSCKGILAGDDGYTYGRPLQDSKYGLFEVIPSRYRSPTDPTYYAMDSMFKGIEFSISGDVFAEKVKSLEKKISLTEAIWQMSKTKPKLYSEIFNRVRRLFIFFDALRQNKEFLDQNGVKLDQVSASLYQYLVRELLTFSKNPIYFLQPQLTKPAPQVMDTIMTIPLDLPSPATIEVKGDIQKIRSLVYEAEKQFPSSSRKTLRAKLDDTIAELKINSHIIKRDQNSFYIGNAVDYLGNQVDFAYRWRRLVGWDLGHWIATSDTSYLYEDVKYIDSYNDTLVSFSLPLMYLPRNYGDLKPIRENVLSTLTNVLKQPR